MKLTTLKRNAVHNVVGWLLPTAIFFVLTPVMIRYLGTEGFGVIALIQIITGYMNVMNFGFSEAVTKHVAEHYDRDRPQAMRVMWAGFWLFVAAGLIGGVALWFAAEWLGRDLLKIPKHMQDDAVTALKISSLVFLLQMIAEYYRGAAIGCHRFDVPNLSRIVRIALSAIFIVAALYLETGLTGVMLATLLGLVAGLILNAWWMEKIVPLRHEKGEYRALLAELFHFSKHVFFVRLAGMVSSKISQFFLGTLSSVANVALYEVPTRVAETGSVVLNRILQVFYPGFAAMDRNAELGRIRDIFKSVLSIQLLIVTPVMLIAVLEGPALLAAWISPEFAEQSSGIITLVAATYFFSTLTNLPVFAAMSFGMPGLVSKYTLIRLVITLVLVYPFVSGMGLQGAAWVLFLAELQAIPLILETGRRLFSLNLLRELAQPLAIHLAVAGCIYLTYEHLYRGTAGYSPLAVLLVGLVHPAITMTLGATTPADNRRLARLLLAWR